ncbi:MAG: CvpA family protein [Verrucomicrobiota bacterium]|nr:CvpA family protein [Verrucomicrobiota bacterium]
MWIYLLIGLLLLILASESYFKGGVNALLTLLGVVLAVNVADSFGPMAFQWMGDKWWPIDEHPFWNRAVPVVAGFITLVVIFSIVGTVASIMVRKRLESQWEDYKLENYKTMNRKFGLCIGLITASVYSVMGLTLIYQLGNFTGPLRHDTDPWPLKTLNEAREQLDNTPFIKLAAAYDNTPKLDYEVRDTLALLLKNRASTIEEHMRAYPGFFALGETEEIKGLLGDEEEEEEEEEEYGGYGAEDDGTQDDGGDSLYAIWKSGSLSLTNLLSNSEVRSTVNERYEELKAIEPNSTEEKKLLAFMDDIRHFFKTGESELYNKDAIVGRWRFAPNVSLRENKKTRTTISVDEMRGIQATVGKMRRMTLQIWPEADQKQIRVNGLSLGSAYDDVLKKLRTLYQKAVDEGDVDDDAFGYGGGYSQPVGFEQTYGTQEGEGENQGKVDEAKRMLNWINAKDPSWVPRQFYEMLESGTSMQIGSGKWEGSGIRFQVTFKQGKVNLSKAAEFLAEEQARSLGGSLKAGWPLRSGKLMTNIVKGRLHVQSGRDVFVFTRY